MAIFVGWGLGRGRGLSSLQLIVVDFMRRLDRLDVNTLLDLPQVIGISVTIAADFELACDGSTILVTSHVKKLLCLSMLQTHSFIAAPAIVEVTVDNPVVAFIAFAVLTER